MRWYSSDMHFGHERIIELCGRPFKNADYMNEVLIKNWNSLVHPEDEAFLLGDLALGDKSKWEGVFSRLNGRLTMVTGNHDATFKANKPSYRERHGAVYEKYFERITDEVIGHELSGGVVVNLSHFPYHGDSHGEDRYAEYRLADEGVPLLHGHTHSTDRLTYSAKDTPQIHVGVDAWSFAPVSEEQILDIHKWA